MRPPYRLLTHDNGFTIECDAGTFEEGSAKKASRYASLFQCVPFVSERSRWGFRGTIALERHGSLVRIIVPISQKTNTRTHISMSLRFLFVHILGVEVGMSESQQPLVSIKSLEHIHGGFSGFNIVATLSPRMMRLVAEFTPEHRARIASVMRNGFVRMMGGTVRADLTRCETSADMFALEVPGNATTLSGRRFSPFGSVSLSGHNIDNPVQQFACLLGLAEAHAIAESLDSFMEH